MYERVLILGSTGFIGSYLIKEFSKKYPLRAFVEKSDFIGLKFLKQTNVELFAGDIFIRDDVANALKNIDAVIYAAGSARFTKEYKENYNENVAMLNSFLDVLKNSTVKRFIYISTVGVLGESLSKDETSPYAPDNTAYSKTKTIAEKMLFKTMQDINTETIIARPSLVYGLPLIKRPFSLYGGATPLPIMINFIYRGFYVFVKKNVVMQWIHVEDLAKMILQIFKTGKNGEIFILAAPEPIKIEKIVLLIKDYLKKENVSMLYVPYFISKLIGALIKISSKAFNKTPLITDDVITALKTSRVFNNLHSIERLGYRNFKDFEKELFFLVKAIKPMLPKPMLYI